MSSRHAASPASPDRTGGVRRLLAALGALVALGVLLVGVPFVFSLYLAMSDASVGDPVARFVGLENFRSALESSTFWVAPVSSSGGEPASRRRR